MPSRNENWSVVEHPSESDKCYVRNASGATIATPLYRDTSYLIAASPDMRDAIMALFRKDGPALPYEDQKRLVAAIDKAKGRRDA